MRMASRETPGHDACQRLPARVLALLCQKPVPFLLDLSSEMPYSGSIGTESGAKSSDIRLRSAVQFNPARGGTPAPRRKNS